VRKTLRVCEGSFALGTTHYFVRNDYSEKINLKNYKNLLLLLGCAALLVPACAHAQTPPAPSAARANASAVVAPPQAKEGAPLREGDSVLFRFHAPANTVKVFVAGSFNEFALNQNGAVTDDKFALTKAGDGFFWTRALVDPKVEQYKYVVLDTFGGFSWVADPFVKETDKDGNSTLDFGKIERLPASLTREGAPLRDGDAVVFRFRAPSEAMKVFLAGSFNGFANPQEGVVSDEAFAMTRGADGLYSKRVVIGATTEKYKYVVLGKNGGFTWVADPFVKATDADGNTVVVFSQIERIAQP